MLRKCKSAPKNKKYFTLLQNHVCPDLYLKYLKVVAIVPSWGERSSGKEVNKDIRVSTLYVGTMSERSK